MRIFYSIFFVLVSCIVFAQEMIVPSSFDENKMIVKKMDKDGNFVPVDENTLPDVLAKDEIQTQKPKSVLPKAKKKLKKVETGYDFPKTTFGTGVDSMQLPSTFATDTMSQEMNAVNRDHTSFQECDEKDKNCQEYEVDEKGQVIF